MSSRMKTFFSLLLIFSLNTASAAVRCEAYFSDAPTRSSVLKLSEDQILAPKDLSLDPQHSVRVVGQTLKQTLAEADLRFLPPDSIFAINLSKDGQIHLVTQSLTESQHQQLLVLLRTKNVEVLMSNIPILFRNKYYEVQLSPLSVVAKFARDLSFPIESQILNGFATRQTEKVRPFQSDIKRPGEKIRDDLMRQTLIQDTLATCGLASVLKIFSPRQIKTTESELLKNVKDFGIREINEMFGADPGLGLSDLAKLLIALGHRHGFSVREVTVTSAADQAEFSKVAEIAATQGSGTDVIVNYASPGVGRPGGGHFTPVGGFNSKTNEVLLSEVNLAFNPAFWVKQDVLVQSMEPPSAGAKPRGYLVIEWNK